MAKRKSIRDIQEQLDRIRNASIQQTTDYLNSGRGVDGDARDMQLIRRRINASNAASRYVVNIQNAVVKRGNSLGTLNKNSKFSRSTYMGASVG